MRIVSGAPRSGEKVVTSRALSVPRRSRSRPRGVKAQPTAMVAARVVRTALLQITAPSSAVPTCRSTPRCGARTGSVATSAAVRAWARGNVSGRATVVVMTAPPARVTYVVSTRARSAPERRRERVAVSSRQRRTVDVPAPTTRGATAHAVRAERAGPRMTVRCASVPPAVATAVVMIAVGTAVRPRDWARRVPLIVSVPAATGVASAGAVVGVLVGATGSEGMRVNVALALRA